jgi:hypothetical protein
MTDESQKPYTPNEEFGISLDLGNNEIEIFKVAEPPKSWQFGMFISLRTGSKQQMEALRASIIMNSLKSLRRFERGGSK